VAQPRISDSRDFYALSRRYPKLLLLLDHRQGGGDREWAIKGRRDCPNVCVDTSGSVLEDDAIERAVRTLGPRRLLFATDITMEGGAGEIFSAERTAEEREDIFWRNLHGLLGEARMIIDSHAHLGHHPFRALRRTTAAAMIGRMDRNGIGKAVVPSWPTVF
jgi:hypothetical protein